MAPTYGRVLSAIENAFYDLVEEYQSIRKFLQDLVEGQERNIAQLARIGTVVNQKWDFKEDLWGSDEEYKKEDGNKEGFKEEHKENQKEVLEGTSLLVFY